MQSWKCDGCGEYVGPTECTRGHVVTRGVPNDLPRAVDYCEACWAIVDGAAEDGSYGAAAVDVMRAPEAVAPLAVPEG